MIRVWRDLTVVVAACLVAGWMLAESLLGQARAQTLPIGPIWSCSLDNVGATLTKCQTADVGGKRLYITDIIAQSTTATGGQFILRTGTGTDCGTGTASLLPSGATAARLGYAGNASSPTHLRFGTPVVTASAKDLCVLAVATNTISIQITGYLYP